MATPSLRLALLPSLLTSSRQTASFPSLRSFTSSPVTAKAATTTEGGKREPRGIMKPKRVSTEMKEFLGGVEEIPRTQALKHIWAHIKEQHLQDPDNKKVIVCDDKLKSIFAGKDRVGFLEIAGLISPHFLKGDQQMHPYRINAEVGNIDDNAPDSDCLIHAGSVGNVAKFINHRCEPNLFVQ